MKPIPSPMSRQALDLMNKAQELTQRIDALEKGKGKPCCEGMAKMGTCKTGCTAMEKADGHESKIKNCLKKKGGAASLKECADECGVSTEECKKVIDKMNDVKISPHGDVILMDGLQKGLEMVEHEGKKVPKFAADGKGAKDMKAKADMAIKDSYCMKNFGKKYSECSENEKAQCDKAHGKPDKDDKMKGDGVFTIGDAQRRNAGLPPEPRQEMDYSEAEGDYEEREEDKYATPMQQSPMSMREDNTTARTLPLSEGKTREQKRGDASRGVRVKRPGFRGPPMPLSDKSASGKPERIVDARMKKAVAEGAQPGFITSYDSSPMGVMFMSETGGQTRNAYYTTNQYPYNAEDVTNKGATSVQVSLDKLAAMLNPHEGGGVSRLDNNGVLSNNPY